MYWVYILENYIKSDFISVTIDMGERLKEHREEMVDANMDPDQLKVKYQEYHANAVEALFREKELKAMTPFRLNKYLNNLLRDQGFF